VILFYFYNAGLIMKNMFLIRHLIVAVLCTVMPIVGMNIKFDSCIATTIIDDMHLIEIDVRDKPTKFVSFSTAKEMFPGYSNLVPLGDGTVHMIPVCIKGITSSLNKETNINAWLPYQCLIDDIWKITSVTDSKGVVFDHYLLC
jgi:hypothetical protein